MRSRTATAAVLLAVSGAVGVIGAAPAAAVCDAYSGSCTEPPSVLPSVLTSTPATAVRSSTTRTPSSLPFTGGELVLVSVAGVAAVGGGIALVAAGRRRSSDSA